MIDPLSSLSGGLFPDGRIALMVGTEEPRFLEDWVCPECHRRLSEETWDVCRGCQAAFRLVMSMLETSHL